MIALALSFIALLLIGLPISLAMLGSSLLVIKLETSVTVRPETPVSERASRTSSSLKDLIMASIFFIAGCSEKNNAHAAPVAAAARNRRNAQDSIGAAIAIGHRVAPVLAETAPRYTDTDQIGRAHV